MASINDDGSITLIITTTNNLHSHRYFLPNDKAIKVAISLCTYFALGSKGKVYSVDFYQCEEREFLCYGNIENKEIIDIDGHGGHCLAVSKN